jgi:gluconolactonase
MGGSEATTVDDLGICYISPDGKTVTRVIKGVNANGLIGTPDGKTLYTTGEGGICSYQINSDGSVSNKKLFCEDSTDGMAMDEHQNVYLIGDQVTIYNPKGEKIEEIALPEKMCKNLTFGGKDRKTLFITGNTGVYTLEMDVRGASAPLDLVSAHR